MINILTSEGNNMTKPRIRNRTLMKEETSWKKNSCLKNGELLHQVLQKCRPGWINLDIGHKSLFLAKERVLGWWRGRWRRKLFERQRKLWLGWRRLGEWGKWWRRWRWLKVSFIGHLMLLWILLCIRFGLISLLWWNKTKCCRKGVNHHHIYNLLMYKILLTNRHDGID